VWIAGFSTVSNAAADNSMKLGFECYALQFHIALLLLPLQSRIAVNPIFSFLVNAMAWVWIIGSPQKF